MSDEKLAPSDASHEEKSPPRKISFARVREIYTSIEARLSPLTRRQLIFLVLGLGLGTLALGFLLGILISPSRSAGTPSADLSSSQENQTVSHTGIVRRLEAQEEGADFYLEKSNGDRVLLKSSQIDLLFFVGASVTAEGVSVETVSGQDELLLVSKIRIK